jgi:hypothetical protein
MAGLDTSIALGIKPVDFGDPNEGRMNALRAQMMQMQMQQGQFNMMKAQRDMQYQDQQRAQAAAAVARDKAAEKEAINAFLKTAQPGSAFNPNPNTPYVPDDASAEGSGAFPGWNNAQPPDMNATIQQLVNAGKFEAAKKIMGQNQAFNVNTESNLKIKKSESELAKADLERGAKAIEFHASALPTVTPETWGAWRENAIKDLPGLRQILPETAPADPAAFDQLKRSLILKAQDSVKQHYQSVTRGDETGVVAIDPVKLTATNVAGAEGTAKSTGKTIKLQQLQDLRDKLRADLETNPDDKNTQQALAEVTANINKEAKFAGAGQDEGKKGFDAALKDIADQYKKLGAQGMLITPQSSIGNRAAGVLSDLAPGVTTIVSPERGAPVAALKNLRENMKAAIIQASGGALTSKNFDSNAEAKSLLDSMSSPGQPLDAIVDTLNSLSRKYGTGNVLTAEDLTGGKEQNTSSGKSKPPLSSFAR